MDPEEEYPSDSDASDEDFRPDKEEGSASELESDDNVEEDENGEDRSTEPKAGKKRKKATGKKFSKKRTKVAEEVPEEKETEKNEELDEEDEERLTDALWADFLAGSNSSSTSSSTKEPAKKEPVKATIPTVAKPAKPAPIATTKPETVTKIFEFAGETVEVTEPASASKPAPPTAKPLTANGGGGGAGGPRPPLGGRPSGGGGLGAVLGQLGKKNKLSVLEKTQLDWKSFKRTEGIEEELQTHNRGRDGYLERQDFLQRADLRQFEIEKNFRQSKSKR